MNTYGDLWHENLPSYSGRKIPLSIDVESIKNTMLGTILRRYAKALRLFKSID